MTTIDTGLAVITVKINIYISRVIPYLIAGIDSPSVA